SGISITWLMMVIDDLAWL
ncbi:hypothetical protein D049_0167B, partial [Vibrio parahaemolyticus VPTS-2010]